MRGNVTYTGETAVRLPFYEQYHDCMSLSSCKRKSTHAHAADVFDALVGIERINAYGIMAPSGTEVILSPKPYQYY